MAVTIEINGHTATVDGAVWRSADARTAAYLNARTATTFERSPSRGREDLAIAQTIIEHERAGVARILHVGEVPALPEDAVP